MPEFGENRFADVYKDFFHINNENSGIDSTLRFLRSGNDTDTNIKISSSQVEINHADGQSIQPRIKSGRYVYLENDNVSGSSYSVSLSGGNIQKVILTNNLTNLVFIDVPDSGVAGWIRLIIERSTFTITNWPSGSIWANGTALNLSSTTNGTTAIVDFMTIDNGSTWYATTVAVSMA